MAGIETRNRSRESLFMFAEVQVENLLRTHRIRVRNLSDNGMMGAGELRVVRGSRLTVFLPGADPVTGQVAWVQDDRFGIAFDEEIDSRKVMQANAHQGEDHALDNAIVRRRVVAPAPGQRRNI